MAPELIDHYRAVRDDLLVQQRRLAAELAEVEQAIAAIERRIAHAPKPTTSVASRPLVAAPPRADGQMDYSKVSVRWAVLALLAEVATGPMGTGAIAEALQARGVVKEGPSRFGNIVSAVLSNLKAKGEVEAVDGGLYQLTEAGRTMWAHIRSGHKFRLTQAGDPGLLAETT